RPRLSPRSTLFPYTTLFRSVRAVRSGCANGRHGQSISKILGREPCAAESIDDPFSPAVDVLDVSQRVQRKPGSLDLDSEVPDVRSEEHTSELQSREKLVCRL